MPKMQTANCVVAVGGDAGNCVPKFGVTAAEVAVLVAIHGAGAISDLEVVGDVERSHRDERARLLNYYSRMHDGKDTSPVSSMFPGVAARVFESFDEIEIEPEAFKARSRMTAADAPKEENLFTPKPDKPAKPAKPLTPAQKKEADKRAATEAFKQIKKEPSAAVPRAPTGVNSPNIGRGEDPDDDNDGVGEMDDMKKKPDAFA